jgi:beta-galactosidase
MSRNSILHVLLATVLNVLAFGQGARAAINEPSDQMLQSGGGAATPAFVWLESESAKTSFKASIGDWGRPQFLSAGNWIHISVDEDKVEKEVPEQGIVLEYSFQGPKTARYEVWNRVGFEFVRSSFEWRIDEGAWKQASPDELTTDLMEMGNWCEVAWLKLGDEVVSAGGHRLQIRLSKTKDNKGKWQRVLYASDAICLHEGPFHPNSKFKPGESGRDAGDEAAGKVVFQVPDAKPSQRASVKLGGVWEIARDDEQMPGEVAEPIRELPKHPIWRAIPVPGDKNTLRGDLVFAHRFWYRTRIAVPTSMASRAFYVEFPYNNLNTTIFVNEVYCGFEKNPFAPFQMDVTKGIKAGQTNEIWVGIRDAWYGRSADPKRPLKLRKTFNYPIGLFNQGFQDMDYPVWNCPQSGILATPAFVATGGGVYAGDVFVKPSVAQKRLEADASLNNTTGAEVSGEIRWEAVDDTTGQTQHVFKPQPFKIAAGQTQTITLSDAWTNPRLWWPDTPNLYRLRTTVLVDGTPSDVKETLFGFREWRREGTQFTLNGVVWHMWADLIGEEHSPEKWLATYKRTNQRTTRLSTAGQAGHESRWLGLEPQDAIEFCDRNGVVVRRNTTLDGETIGYQFSEGDAETRQQQGGSELKLALMKNWREQCVAQVKGERNHASIQVWSLENEFAFINLINLLGNSPNMDRYEEEITKAHDAVMAADPTRSAMTDGGGATIKNTLGVHGNHYVATLDARYPDLAYEPFTEGGGRGRWKWDQQRPRFIGEDFYATGINPADYAMWGGEIAFQGKAATREAIATCYRMLNEGYRWGGYCAAWHFWLGGEGGPKQWGANQPRAVLVRQWDWTFGSSQRVKRTFGIFNDTQYAEPITFSRRLTVEGKEAYAKISTHNVAPGTVVKFDEEIPMPSVATRQEGELSLTLSAGGKEVYHDTKAVSVLPAAVEKKLAAGMVAVFDPIGETTAFLKSAGVPFATVQSLDTVPAGAKVLVVGRDAIEGKVSTSTRLAVLASEGRAVVVLDQSNPLKYQAIPAEMELAPRTKKSDFGDEMPTAEGRTAFIEDISHPALRGLKDKDFFTWGPDLPAAQAGQPKVAESAHLVFRNAYVKPTRGGKSLIQCGPRLEYSALVEVPVGRGVMYLCQLDLGSKLAVNPVAEHVLVNLIRCGAAYKLEHAEVTAVIGDEQLGKAVDAIGLEYAKAGDALAAIKDANRKIALVSATPANLRLLAGNPGALESFWQHGGALILCGLTPEGLADYNRVVGVNHVIRPFTRERVTFPASRNPLTAGLTVGDIVMLSGKRIFDWTADEYAASDIFGYVVDLDDLAPFAKSDFSSYANIVNGFVGSDGWPLVIDFEYPKDGKPYVINMDLPQEETIVEYTHKASVNYNATTKIALLFDGKDRVEYDLQPNGEAQTFAVNPPRKARRVTLQLVSWLSDPAKRPLLGIDNIWLKVARSPEWQATVKPMLNIGGMVQYVKGSGSVVLCNLNFKETEAVPANKTKKLTILATLLRNLNAPFSSGKTVIAGADLAYTPIDIHTKATTYKDERGWFGDKRRTLKALPPGEHVFAGVKFNVYEMPTSPVPQVLVLGGNGVPGNLPNEITGIPINTKADALFFLHTARLDRRMDDREREEKKRFELCRYVMHYADGQTAEVPIFCEIDIDHFLQQELKAIPGAQIAWSGKFEDSNESAVVFAKQWNNPRPGVEIKAVDLVYGKDRDRGVPALLAITAATAQ